MDNGGIIGKNISFNNVSLSGMWSVNEVQRARLGDQWPQHNFVTTGMVGRYDAGLTASYPGSGSTWTNIAPGATGSNITLVNGPTYGAGSGGHIAFDGTNDYGTIAAGNIFQVATESDSLSICMAFRPDTALANDEDIFMESGAVSWNWAYYLNKLNFYPGANTNQATWSPTTGNWYFLTAVYDASGAGTNYMYVNNTLNYSVQGNGPTVLGSQIFYLMSRQGSSLFTPASIGLIYVYNRALSSVEVGRNYDGVKARFGI